MEPRSPAAIRFVLNGRHHELSREAVERRLLEVAPEPIRKHAVRVNGTWFPAIQAFEVATGIPRAQFISHTARRHLSALGYEVAGQVEPRGLGAPSPVVTTQSEPPLWAAGPAPAHVGEWHTEANVQAFLVTALATEGWRILSVANTATKEHGIDVIATLEDLIVGVEVKGYPGRGYADPARAGELKPTSPSTQAGHWYSQAVLAAMRLRGKEPSWRSVIALPEVPRYRTLHEETAGSLAAAQIEVWWLDAAGTVTRP